MPTATVTGAAGFAGTHLTRALVHSGRRVYAVVRPGSPHNERICGLPNVRLIECDMLSYDKLPTLIADDVDEFYHLAWQGGRNDFYAQEKNIAMALTAVEAAARLNCRRFLATGSQAEYGLQTELITEGTFPVPVTDYGAVKLATMHLTKRLATERGVEWLWGRIFSLYGEYEPAGRMIADLARALTRGETFNLTAATQNWDYLLADECAEALIAIMERGRSGEVYNIAHGDYRPLRSFTEELLKYIGHGQITYGKEVRLPVSLQPSVEKICRDTGWRAKLSFGEGIRRNYTV